MAHTITGGRPRIGLGVMAGVGALLVLGLTSGCVARGGSGPGTDGGASSADGPPGEEAGAASGDPDRFWLERIGQGPAQLRRVCSRSRDDRITRSLCDATGIDGLAALHRALGLAADASNVSIAAASSGLTFRTTSVLNPRAFLSTSILGSALDRDELAITAFSRGDELVELAAFDRAASRLDFYLLSYRTACDQAGCSAAQLLSADTESRWTSWTVYDEGDLQDTPLDCLSCHQPDGPAGPRRLIMRDFFDPWFHWFDPLLSGYCLEANRTPVNLGPDLRMDFERVHGPSGGYAAVDLESSRLSSGHNLHDLIFLFGDASPLGADPLVMDTRRVVNDWSCNGSNTVWREFRKATLESRGIPVPYYRFDVLDRIRAEPALRDYPGFLAASADRSSFQVLSQLLAEDAQQATGAIVEGGPTAEQILRQACVRCHDDRAPPGSVRASFNVDQITAKSAGEALRRIHLPEDSPYLMPPRRAATLSAAARDQIAAHLRAVGP